MPANKQIVKSWRFWAGIIVGVALTLAVLFLLGHLRPNAASGTTGRADGEFANR